MSQNIVELFKARHTILEQLEAQNYDVSNYLGFSMVEVNAMHMTNQLNMMISHREDNHKLYVLFASNFEDGKQINTRSLDKLIFTSLQDVDADMYENKLSFPRDSLIIVSAVEVNDSLKKFLKELWENHGIYASIISVKRLQFNILKHELVPSHRPVRKVEELSAIKSKYGIVSNDNFPTISRFDAAAMAICLKPGELCEIMRPSKTAILTPYYRMCVNKFE